MHVIDRRERIFVVVETLAESAKKPAIHVGSKRYRSPGADDFPVIAVRRKTYRNAVPKREMAWADIPEWAQDD